MEPPAEPSPAVAPSPAGRHRALTGVLGALALVATFGVGVATGRVTAPKAAAVSAADSPARPGFASATAASQASTSASASATAGGLLQAAGLASALIPLPAGAQPLTVTHASPDGSMNLDQFLELFSSTPSERPLLQARGFEGAASRWMTTASGQEDCIYLIAFESSASAQSYALFDEKAHADDSAHKADTRFAVPSLTDGVGYEDAALDSYGNTDSWVYGSLGNVVVMVNALTPAKPARAQMLTLLDEQAALVSAAEKSG